jgi:hypothetical protein
MTDERPELNVYSIAADVTHRLMTTEQVEAE